jgi:WD40 repeat protein
MFHATISPNNTMVASLSKSSIEVWNLPQHNAIPIQQIDKESEADITDAWFSTDGRYLLIGYDNGESVGLNPGVRSFSREFSLLAQDIVAAANTGQVRHAPLLRA